jgi:hypothetical protein
MPSPSPDEPVNEKATPTNSDEPVDEEAAPTPNSDAPRKVAVVTVPPGGELYERGQRIGRAPLTVDVPAGERRRFEVGLPGYEVRKLVIDGTRAEVVVGMREVVERKKK